MRVVGGLKGYYQPTKTLGFMLRKKEALKRLLRMNAFCISRHRARIV